MKEELKERKENEKTLDSDVEEDEGHGTDGRMGSEDASAEPAGTIKEENLDGVMVRRADTQAKIEKIWTHPALPHHFTFPLLFPVKTSAATIRPDASDKSGDNVKPTKSRRATKKAPAVFAYPSNSYDPPSITTLLHLQLLMVPLFPLLRYTVVLPNSYLPSFPTSWLKPSNGSTGHITLERRRSKCIFCPNSLDDHSPNSSTSCRPVEAMSIVEYSGGHPSSIGNLPALVIPAGLTVDLLHHYDYPRPNSQKVVIATPEVAALIGNNYQRSRNRNK